MRIKPDIDVQHAKTAAEAMQRIADAIGYPVDDEDRNRGQSISITWNPCFHVTVSLYVKIEWGPPETLATPGPVHRIVATVNNSASIKDGATARTMATILAEAADIALFVEACVGGKEWPVEQPTG